MIQGESMSLLKVFLISTLISTSSCANDTIAQNYSFKNIWEKVTQWHPLIKANTHNLEARYGVTEQANKKPNPELELEAEEFGGRGDKSGFDDASIHLSYMQSIERGGKRQRRVAVAKIQEDLQRLNNLTVVLELFFETQENYIEAVFAKDKLKLEEKLYQMTLEFEKAMAKLVRYGKTSPLGLERAKIATNLSKNELTEAQMEVTKSNANLISLFGEYDEMRDIKVETTHSSNLLDKEFSEIDLKNSIHRLHLAKQQELQEALLRLENAGAKSDFTMGGGVQKFMGSEETAFLLRFSVPLGRYDKNQGNIRAQKSRIRAQEQVNKARLLELKILVNNLKIEIETARVKLSGLQNTIVPSSKRLFQKIIHAQRAGKVDYLEVLDVRRTYVENRRMELETRRNLTLKINSLQKTILNRELVQTATKIPIQLGK